MYLTLLNKEIHYQVYNIGIMMVMILYNAFIYFIVRDNSYFYYVIYIIIILLTQTSTQGYTFQYLWPGAPYMALRSLFLFPCLVGIAGMQFMKAFLKLRDHAPYLIPVSLYFDNAIYILI